jgi:hypothetical protein
MNWKNVFPYACELIVSVKVCNLKTSSVIETESAVETLNHGGLASVWDWGNNAVLYLAGYDVQECLPLYKKNRRIR